MAATPYAELNLNHPQIFEEGTQHEVFKELRRRPGLHWTAETEEAKGFWSATRLEDVLFISRHPEIFSSERGIVSFEGHEGQTEESAAAAGNGKMLITMDPPRHVRMRRLVNKGFTPRAVAAMEPDIRRITNDLLDGIAKKGECDFVLEVASQLPLAVICGMMGLEGKDWDLMFQLTNKVLGAGDPEYQTDVPEDQRGTDDAARLTGNMGTMQMFGFFAQQLEAVRIKPRPGLIALLSDVELDGEKLSDEDVLWFCFLLILAGNETTRNAISGGLHTLCEHPEAKTELIAHPELMEVAVEEILRWVSPVMHMARVAKEDVQVGETLVKAGNRVVMWYPSANRDEAAFEDPNRFDIRRDPNDHLAFGIGEHFCLGAGFARLELRVMFEELLRRFPDIELAGEPQRLRSNFIGGIKHLPVRFTPEE